MDNSVNEMNMIESILLSYSIPRISTGFAQNTLDKEPRP